jgi:hypothetical protein
MVARIIKEEDAKKEKRMNLKSMIAVWWIAAATNADRGAPANDHSGRPV